MSVNVELVDFPPVIKMHFTQGSSAKPGRCVVQCAEGAAGNIESAGPPVPRITTLKASTEGLGDAFWHNMLVMKVPRSRKDYLRVVLEDSRWLLREYTLDQNWNERDSCGRVMTATRKTIRELIDLILAAMPADKRITVRVEQDIPSYYPPARWAGKTCAEAMQDLLDNTGCRLVYAPETASESADGSYVFSLAGSGTLPDFPYRIYKPAPKNTLRSVRFISHPVLYEERATCDAVYIDETTGAAVNLSAGDTLGLESSQSSSDHVQHDYRLWKSRTGTGKSYVAHRAKSILNDPERPQMESGRMIRDSWEPFPVHQSLVSRGSDIVRIIELTNGGSVFVTQHPVLSAESSGDISLEATSLTGYYKRDGVNGFFRDHEVVVVDQQQKDEINVFLDWIHPIESNEADIYNPPHGDWEDLMSQVSNALVRKYRPPQGETSQVIETDKFEQLDGTGQIGLIEYEFAHDPLQSAKRHTMRIALNFTPETESSIR